jgi:DNA-binding beta-propeller fold protein YncE
MNQVVRMVDNGVITTVAGTGTRGSSGNYGAATSAQLNGPTGVAVDSAGNLYIAEFDGCRWGRAAEPVGPAYGVSSINQILECNPAYGRQPACGCVPRQTHLAANTPVQPLRRPAACRPGLSARCRCACCCRVRMVEAATGNILPVAGTGECGFAGDGGVGILSQINNPSSVAVDTAGFLYIADTNNNRIRRLLTRPGGIIQTIAGTTLSGYGGNGPASSAILSSPGRVVVAPNGELVLSDNGNNMVRSIRFGTGVPCTSAGRPPPLAGELAAARCRSAWRQLWRMCRTPVLSTLPRPKPLLLQAIGWSSSVPLYRVEAI